MYRTVADSIEAALRIAPLVRACRDEGERERRLPAQVLAAMHEARLFRMYIPKALDGLEIDPITSMIVVEEIARADAAAAWNLMLGATYGLWAAFLPEHAARYLRRLRCRRCRRLAAERPRPPGCRRLCRRRPVVVRQRHQPLGVVERRLSCRNRRRRR